jgi:hypothetical protein
MLCGDGIGRTGHGTISVAAGTAGAGLGGPW